VRPFSREGFQRDLHRCEGVICSSGFELPSEALQLGKKILVQPVAGQMEQKSNAVALEQLGYASVVKNLTVDAIAQWLPLEKPQPIEYPDVGNALAHWLTENRGEDVAQLQQDLWRDFGGRA